MPMLIWALPRSANAMLCISTPLLCPTWLRFTMPLLYSTLQFCVRLRYAAATTCVSLLCLWVDVLGYALPLLYIALLGFALAMLSTSMLRHCRAVPGTAVPPQGIARTRSAFAKKYYAFALLRLASPCHSRAAQSFATLNRAIPLPYLTVPHIAFATPNEAVQRCAIAVHFLALPWRC